MEYHIVLNGKINPIMGSKRRVKKFLQENTCFNITRDDPGTLSVGFSGECTCGQIEAIDSSINMLAPMLERGKINVRNVNLGACYDYDFVHGRCTKQSGTEYVYYGNVDDFIRQLPENLIQTIVQKYGND